MKIKIIKKWIYKHQVESLILLVSLIACIIGNFTVGLKAIVIVAIIDLFVFFGPSLYENYLKVRNIERRHADMVKAKIAAANNANSIKSKSVAALKNGIMKNNSSFLCIVGILLFLRSSKILLNGHKNCQ